MPKRKKADDDGESVLEATKESEEEEPTRADKTEAKAWEVYGKNQELIRTYSLEVHGADAPKLAKQFAENVGGTVKAV